MHDNPSDEVLAYSALSASTYQSKKLNATEAYPRIENRNSRYLRYALINTAKYVSRLNPTFVACLEKKRSENKYYNVAISQAKKIVRLFFTLQTTGEAFRFS